MRTFVLLFVALALALALGGGAVAAQDNATNQTQPNVSVQAQPGDPIDEDLTLVSWEYSGGTFSLTFDLDGDRPKQATISEATQPGEGASQFAIRQERLLPGESTLTLTTRTQGGEAAVSITTADSLADGHGLVVSTGEQQADDPFATFGGTSGVLSGVGLSIIMSGSAAAWVLRWEESGVIKA